MSIVRTVDVDVRSTRTFNIDFVAGDSLILKAVVRDANRRPVSFAGGSARWGLAPYLTIRTLGPLAYSLTSAPGIAISTNEITVTLAASAFDTVGTFLHELEATDAAGKSVTLLRGTFRCHQAVLVT